MKINQIIFLEKKADGTPGRMLAIVTPQDETFGKALLLDLSAKYGADYIINSNISMTPDEAQNSINAIKDKANATANATAPADAPGK